MIAYFCLTHLQAFSPIIFVCNVLLAIALDDDRTKKHLGKIHD
jgi:hypothetical protein